jgi:uncharacterized DUF497 family protein
MSDVIEPFEWDEANIGHIAKHGITPQDAEEVVRNQPLTLCVSLRFGELRRNELGATAAGRVLIVVTVARGYRIRVVTAWPADKGMRHLWNLSRR